jgi:site-specific DNA-adenine methylase
LLSYNDCEEIGELYEDFRIEEINIKYSISSEKINWASKKELLIKNF